MPDTISVLVSPRPGDGEPLAPGHIRVVVAGESGGMTEEEKTLDIGRVAHEYVLPAIPDAASARIGFNKAMDAILSSIARRHGLDVPVGEAEMSFEQAVEFLRTI